MNPSNLREPLLRLRPWAVDVSSGVEQGPGLKSAELINDFMIAVKKADLNADV